MAGERIEIVYATKSWYALIITAKMKEKPFNSFNHLILHQVGFNFLKPSKSVGGQTYLVFAVIPQKKQFSLPKEPFIFLSVKNILVI